MSISILSKLFYAHYDHELGWSRLTRVAAMFLSSIQLFRWIAVRLEMNLGTSITALPQIVAVLVSPLFLCLPNES